MTRHPVRDADTAQSFRDGDRRPVPGNDNRVIGCSPGLITRLCCPNPLSDSVDGCGQLGLDGRSGDVWNDTDPHVDPLRRVLCRRAEVDSEHVLRITHLRVPEWVGWLRLRL